VTTRVRKLGIMTAMDEEFRLIQQAFNFSSCREIGPRRFFTAQHEDIALTLVSSRIGKVAAAVTTSLLLHEYKVDAVLFTGVAGATDPNIRIGDIVVADRLIQHDIDLKGVLGYQRFDIPLLDMREVACHPTLVSIAESAALATLGANDYRREVEIFTSHTPSVHTGIIASGDTFISDTTDRDSLVAGIPGLRCVEMEGAATAQVCIEHGIPFVVARIISDHASGEAPIDFSAFIKNAASVGSEIFVKHFVSSLNSGGI